MNEILAGNKREEEEEIEEEEMEEVDSITTSKIIIGTESLRCWGFTVFGVAKMQANIVENTKMTVTDFSDNVENGETHCCFFRFVLPPAWQLIRKQMRDL